MDLNYARLYDRLASCPATVCSAAGQGANKPSLSFVGFHLFHSSSSPRSSFSSLASLSTLLPTSRIHPTYVHYLYHPLNSALPGFPATHTSCYLPFIRNIQHGVSPSPPASSHPPNQLFARRSYCPRRAAALAALPFPHFLGSPWVAREVPPRAPPSTV